MFGTLAQNEEWEHLTELRQSASLDFSISNLHYAAAQLGRVLTFAARSANVQESQLPSSSILPAQVVCSILADSLIWSQKNQISALDSQCEQLSHYPTFCLSFLKEAPTEAKEALIESCCRQLPKWLIAQPLSAHCVQAIYSSYTVECVA